MFVIVTTKMTANRNVDSNELEPSYAHKAHLEVDVDQQLEFMRAGDHRFTHVRIFNMEFADDGTPSIGSEVEP